ncbi:Outer membrane receptor proteins, mostly Fe transport [Chitinophaga sp. CF118]|uniref:outer membrane beta-barrel protein n=1 Tax=Chitinophaga sp. CF118 TaxID=1884367 RepID=UPI0008F10CDD|nr:outer membrane beta-barrel protein [Chitinophaga sp. CF118]SFD51156.1 Outer membrane receptor proteins, mostly Fe transport [Chitinophaga sp. CF118]
MNKIILFVLLALICASSTYAQKISIKITDSNGHPLPYTTVLLKQTKDSVLVKGELTDAAGASNFDKINDGRYFIQASLMGFGSATTPDFSVDANHKQIQLGPLTLQQASKSLQGVTVSAQKPFIERKNGATVINVESSVAAAGGTALDILKRAPGVQIDQDDNVLVKGKQGVTVMLDGKLTYLSGDQLANLLKSMPAETISQIEIITSPSAKYDAAGNNGIINIKTKKGVVTGFNGSVTAGAGKGRYPFYNAGTTVNWRTEKFNLFGNYNHNDRQFFRDRTLIRNIGGEIPQTFNSAVFDKRHFISNNYKVGLDYFITPKHTVGVLVNGFNNGFQNRSTSATKISNQGSPVIDSISNSFTTNDNHFNNTTVNLNYKGQLDTIGTEISMDADIAKFYFKRNIHLNDDMFHTNDPSYTSPHAIRNNTVTDLTIKSIKADLVLPFTKTFKLETGLKGSFVTTDNDLKYDSLIQEKYEPALTQSNRFIYKENVLAAYFMLKKQIKGTDLQAGLRMEQTESDGNSVTMQTRMKRNYLNFFPSLSADHTFNESHKLGISYSKRIFRPDYDDLNPFIYYIDKYNFGKGNPFLNPEYTHTTELSYTYKQKYIVAMGYSLTNNVILEYLEQDTITKRMTSYEKNFERSNSYYMNITLPLDPFKWWNITNNISLNYNTFNIKDTSINLGSSMIGVNYQSTHTFTLPANWKLELNGYYESPFVWGIFKGRSSYAVGAGVQKSMFSKRAVFKVNVSDIFKGDQFRGTSKNDNLDIKINNRWQSRTVNFTVTWNFGNSAVKGARERQTGTSEEQKRTGG